MTPVVRLFRTVLSAVFAVVVALPALPAADVTWTSGASDGLWATGASWQGGIAPTTGDAVFFGATTGTTSLSYDIADTAPAWAGITFNAGASAYTISGGTMTMAGGTATITNSSTNAQIINSVFASGFTIAGSGNLTLGGPISAGSITKTGTGVLTLSAANTYSGATRVSNGTLTYGAAASSANSDLTVGASGAANVTALTITNTGGTRTISKSLTFDGGYGTANSAVLLNVTNSGSTASVLNFGPLTVQAGFANLSAAANASANQKWNFESLTINNGGMVFLQRNGGAALGGNTNNGTLNVMFATAPPLIGTGSAGTTRGIVAGAMGGSTSMGFLTYDANGLRVLNNPAEQATLADGMTPGQNARAAGGSATTTLSADLTVNSLLFAPAANPGTATIALSGRTLTVTSGMVAGVQNNGGTVGSSLQVIGSTVGDGTLQFGSANGYILADAKGRVVVNSTIAGTGGLSLSLVNSAANSASIVLAGANTITGTARMIGNQSLSTNTVRLTHSLALQNLTLDYNNYGTSFTFGNGGTTGLTAYTFGGLQGAQNIALINNNTTPAAVALTVGGNGNSTTYSGVLSGSAGSLIKAGPSALTLTAANTYTGATTISSGTLQIGNGGTTGSLSGSSAITNDAVLAFNRSNALTQGTDFSSAAISGTGSLIKAGAGSLTLTAANTYTGATIINEGTLALGVAGSFASSSLITVGGVGSFGAVLDLTAKTSTFAFGAGQTLGGIGTVRMDAGDTVQIAGLLSPGNSPGILTFDGGTTLLSGTAQMEIFGSVRGTDYDAVDLVNNAIFDYAGGTLFLDFGSWLAAPQTYQLFGNGSSTLQGGLSAVTIAGSNYSGLTFTRSDGVWTSQGTSTAGQTLAFTEATGQLVIVVPEPGAIALAGVGVAIAGWTLRKRRRIAEMPRSPHNP